jgi:predicted metal-dependent phosphoesterase TrpH
MEPTPMRYVDLHLHTLHSDGADTPQAVVERAAKLGIAAIAITDHDTISGLAEGHEHAQRAGIELLAGVEISVDFQNQETHVLAYGFEESSPKLAEILLQNQLSRKQRSIDILEKLKELGVSFDYKTVQPDGGAAGRMHIAQAMRDQGITKTIQEAFDRFLKFGKPAFVPRKNIYIETALEVVHNAGGLVFLAHPGLNKGLRKRVPALLELPFDGIEAYHSKHTAGDTNEFLQLAQSRNLLVSGGSDCHGAIKGGKPDMGTVQTPMKLYHAILEKLDK